MEGTRNYVCEHGPHSGDDGQPLMCFKLEVTWPDSLFRTTFFDQSGVGGDPKPGREATEEEVLALSVA